MIFLIDVQVICDYYKQCNIRLSHTMHNDQYDIEKHDCFYTQNAMSIKTLEEE